VGLVQRVVCWAGGLGRKVFFFEKKEPKNFCSFGDMVATRRTPRRKSFLLLFFKKEALLSSSRTMLYHRVCWKN
jgi:hypothetical protein